MVYYLLLLASRLVVAGSWVAHGETVAALLDNRFFYVNSAAVDLSNGIVPYQVVCNSFVAKTNEAESS
jgi:hypothetical protein